MLFRSDRSSFRLGWDAARANQRGVLVPEEKLKELQAENDRLFFNQVEWATEHPTYKLSKELERKNKDLEDDLFLLKAAAEKLAEALEYAKKDPTWYANLLSKATVALTEYRSKFPKEEK